jgi:hypothetical protein
MYRLLIILALLVSGCESTSQYVPKDAPAQVSAEPVKVGDYWEYSVRDGYTNLLSGTHRYEVMRVDADSVTVRVTRDGKPVETQVYAAGWNGRDHALTNLQRFRYDPPYPAYAFPLAPGKSWSTIANATDPATGKTYRVHVQAKVQGWERVKVPAGEFDALRVQRYVFAGNQEGFNTQEEIAQTDWYSPAARRPVRSQGTSSHYDRSRSNGHGEDGGPLLERGDWLNAELVRYSVR